ncbi:MAG: hypothetical protein RSE41_04050 [Clostridia bacterium]
MITINKNNVKLKNLLGLVDNPNKYDLLYEIINFLNEENRLDGIFTLRDVSLKTKIRITDDVEKDLKLLIEEQYIKQIKKTTFEVIKHKWE